VRFRGFYYQVKPFVPWAVRTTLRRFLLGRTLDKYRDIWPIYEAAGRAPEGWTGWPDGKRFALVLTHDVEGAQGVTRCRALADLEAKMGLRSSFNFVPEKYETPKELRDELCGRGFEVGIHGLKHDGKLYSSRAVFRRRAQRINAYLKDWNCVGFRSPLMHHNLEWLHDLNIKYDASTFDTDPFEPQPDGVDTVFPFWVDGPEGRPGYVELPYSLPQDFTVFVLLKEKDISLWQKKLDWVVQRGGMVLMNTHPDYMCFNEGSGTAMEYPVERYQQILSYVKQKYEGQYWHALPRDVAAFCEKRRFKRLPISKKRICMVSYSFFKQDNRVMRYADALVERGDRVDVIALKPAPDSPTHEIVNGTRLHRVQLRRKDEKGKVSYLLRLLKFLGVASWHLARKHVNARFDLIHVHNIPDFLVFTTLIPKLTGARVILDIHDIVPEFFGSKFGGGSQSPYFKLLLQEERLSAALADHIIISNHIWQEKLIARSIPQEKCSVIVNHVDMGIFYPHQRIRKDGAFLMSFPGGLQWHQGLDVAIRAFAIVVKEFPDAQFHIHGDGSYRDTLVALIHELRLEDSVKIFDAVPIRDVPTIMANSDLGIVPKRADSFGNEAYSTKIMEFMSQGVPVLISRTKIDSFYYNDSVVRFFESGNVDDLATKIICLIRNPALRKSLIAPALEYVNQNNWGRKKEQYFQLVDALISREKVHRIE
jgi:glycosyltransferase involved in cell wall biosynthesis